MLMSRVAWIFLCSAAILGCAAFGMRFMYGRDFVRVTVPSAVERSEVSGLSSPTTTQNQEINPALLAQPAAIVSDIVGTALIERDGQFRFAYQHETLRPGDVLRVGRSSSVNIVWPQYGRTRVDQHTVLQMIDVFESMDRERLNIRMDLVHGRIWTRFGRPVAIGSRFEIRAGALLVNSHGMPSFGVERTDEDSRVLSVSSGAVVRQVVDQPPTIVERLNGASEGFREQQVGDALILSSKSVIDCQGSRLGVPTALSSKALRDAFLLQGDVPVSAEELNLSK